MVTSLVGNAALDACPLYCKAVQSDVLELVHVRGCTVLDLVTGHTGIEPNDPVHVSFVHRGMVLVAAGGAPWLCGCARWLQECARWPGISGVATHVAGPLL